MLAPGMASLQAYIEETDKAAKEGKEPPKVLMTTVESDLVTLLRQKQAGKPVEANLEKILTGLKTWWDTQGRPHYEEDKKPLDKRPIRTGPKTPYSTLRSSRWSWRSGL